MALVSAGQGLAAPGETPGNTGTKFIDAANYGAPFRLPVVWIPAGDFTMGDRQGNGQDDEQPLRRVHLQGFWLMQTEVTRAMYAEFVEVTGYDGGDHCWIFEGSWKTQSDLNWQDPGFIQAADHPVTCINWHDAQAFVRWLNRVSSLTFRLPSEAEWEYAARVGTTGSHYTGTDLNLLCQHANGADQSALQDYPGFSINDCDDGFVRTAPVSSFQPNPFGLYDMYGNVWEWVEDCWQESYNQAPLDNRPNYQGDCERRGFRGGGYGDIPSFTRSSLRNRGDANKRKDDIGFRMVLDLLPARAGTKEHQSRIQ